MTICAIHQPNFFPWLGYFDKIKKADIFIFLDEVAYPKSGSGAGSWCNRVKLLSESKPDWYGLPIARESGDQLIKDVNFSNQAFALKKLFKKLKHNYAKRLYFEDTFEWLEPLFFNQETNLAEYNIQVIQTIAKKLGIKTKFVRQSELTHQAHSTALLVELIKAVNADAYLCGGGADGYQEDHLFADENIKLIYQNKLPMNFGMDGLPEKERSLSVVHHLMSHESL